MIGRIFLSLFVGSLLLLSFCFAFLQTDLGTEVVRHTLISLAHERGIELEIAQVQGRLPFRWKLIGVKIQRTLFIGKVKGKFSFFSLFKGKLYLKSIKLFDARIDDFTFNLEGKGLLGTNRFELSEITLHSPLLELSGFFVLTPHLHIETATAYFTLKRPFKTQGEFHLHKNAFLLTSTGSPFSIGTQTFSSSSLILKAEQKNRQWLGDLALKVASDTLPISLTAELLLDPKGELSLRDLYLLAPETEIGGKLFFHFPNYTLDGALFAQMKDLSVYRKLWPHSGLQGSLGGELTLTSAPEQIVGVHLVMEHFGFGAITAHHLSLKSRVNDFFHAASGFLSLESEQLKFRDLTLDVFTFDAQAAKGRVPFSLTAKGSWVDPLSLKLGGSIDPSALVTIDRFDADAIKKQFHLKTPFSIQWGERYFALTPAHIDFSGGWLLTSCTLSPTESHLVLKSEHFPLDFFSLTGSAGIDFDLQANEKKTSGHLNLLLESLRLFPFGKPSPVMAKGTLSANFSDETIQLHGHLNSSENQFFNISATLPVAYSPFPPALTFDKEKPASGELSYEGRVEELLEFFNLKGQEIKGLVSTHLFLSNTLQDPFIKGALKVTNGSYENYHIGTSLKEINATLDAENERITLTSFSAKGPQSGTLAGKGHFSLRPEEHYPYHFDATLENLSGVDFDMITPTLTGPLNFDGSLKELLIHGKLTATHTEIKVPDRLPVDIPYLAVTIINPPPHLDLPPLQNDLFPVHYDLSIKATDHVFVRGRGLNSEWKGKTHIQGKDRSFTAEGDLSLVRGEFNFSGQLFSLTKGEITFSEKGAQIDLRGTLQTGDALITAILSGSLTSPSLTFQSMPPMPTSSILARLLFKKDISEITPFQAIQLAQTIVTLSGQSGPDLLEKIRSSLGVDRFNLVSTGSSDDISLQIGKYLIQGVMVTLSQSAHSSQAIVEVELKAGFIFQAETQEEEEGKFSLKWNLNY